MNTRRSQALEFLRSAGLQLALTVACAVTGLAGAAVGRWAPESGLRIPLYIVAFVCGGFGPVRDLVRNILARQLDINLLMVVAAAGSAFIGHWGEGVVLLFLFSLSGALESATMERTARSIESLVQLRPDTAMVLRDGGERRVPVAEVAVGERVRALPGERFAVDGIVEEGGTTVDESTITGESAPIDKRPGDPVFAGTANFRGAPIVRVTHTSDETTLSKIVRAVKEARKEKSTTERFVDRWQRPYVVGVFGGSLLTLAIHHLLLHAPASHAFYHAMVFLVAASPCAVVIATPAAMLSAITHAAHHGVLFKGSAHLERLSEIQAIALDKTGTVTHGKPRVVEVRSGEPPDAEDELLRLAAAVEARSEHPTGRAVVEEAGRRQLTLPHTTEFESHIGEGAHGHVEGLWVGVGREALFTSHQVPIPAPASAAAEALRDGARTALLVVAHRPVNGVPEPSSPGGPDGGRSQFCGAIAVTDTVRPEARGALRACRALGVRHVALVTGDHERIARQIGEEIGADEVLAGLLPEEKVSAIRGIQKAWPGLAMVGDGVNDAPALAAATVGVAMGGAGTDVALDTADVVLMRDDLRGIPFSLWMARRAQRVVTQSLSIAFGVIGVLVLSTLTGVLPLWIAVVCHEGSTLLTIANGVRLLRMPHPQFDLA
jgi:Cd2+/Zn2+-exporting ATPase